MHLKTVAITLEVTFSLTFSVSKCSNTGDLEEPLL